MLQVSWTQKFEKILSSIVARKDSEAFREPVPYQTLGILDYPMIIKRPMDLGTVRRNLEDGKYHTYDEAAADMRLIFWNSILYNAPGNLIFFDLIDSTL
jgi:hypothetical protein